MVRILWINPVGTDAYDAPIGAELRAEAAPATRVDVCSLPGVGPQHLEWNALEAVVAGPTMGVVRWASKQQGYDAAVIGCFYDPFLRGARELAGPMAVTAPAEACLHIAATVGERVSILVGRRKWIPEMHENVVKYGHGDHLASFRVLDMSVDEFQADPRPPSSASSPRQSPRCAPTAPTPSCWDARSSSASTGRCRTRSASR